MPESLSRLFEPFLALPPAKRWIVGGVVALSVVAFAVMIMVANKTDYKPLFANLTSEDAGEIVKKLKEQKIPFQIASDGKAVLVPADKVYDLRLSLASEGLPQGGGIGFEIFDRKNFGMTEFVQKLNYQRALQGELARTISQISGVEQARVHLAIPEKSLFMENEKPATASIVLKMKANRSLRENDVQGIVHLAASSVEGLEPEHVTVLDGRGKVLSRISPSDATSKMTSTMQETQRAYEKSMEERLQSLLDKVVGAERSVARVSATFDFKQVEKYEERYDPDSAAVRSEQRSEEKDSGTNVAAGVPGVQTNLGRTAPGSGMTGGGSRSDETLNYEVSRSTARTIEPVGTLSKVSVAILVDGKYEAPAAQKGGATAAKLKYQPRTGEELQKIEALVKSAVGFSAERGDQVTVANIPFQEMEEVGETSPAWWSAPVFVSLLKNGLIGLGFLALLLFVVRPLLKALRPESLPQFEPLESPEEQVQKMLAAQKAKIASQSVNQLELIEKVKQEPYQTSQVLKNWIESKNKA
ncbi:flagellar basal-body MS-ring/collar protein FliF [Geobacter sp. DSM 9736]|uniref:flagellar basal-body MS-ring/collar protein FliF n=1 Tax=Geobacter sp. DSM 9736 TaxID=1277350 RepID=UPI000B502F6C|nr:flagellar basal-body MS-ring/collar protein FliF [Geobacter sp. DSM 9736]SNB47062.1 flagellar M-ring protein FliF [Geobacter sp. DSM 9736]